MTIQFLTGDCREVLRTLLDASVDSCVTDPPYELNFMGRDWDRSGVAFEPDTWRAVLRVLKPGGHLLAFGGTRTFHRLVCAIEDVGFEIRDAIMWHYGSGFPKSLSIALEYERRLCRQIKRDGHTVWVYFDDGKDMARDPPFRDPGANEWVGHGTALKPATEIICLARKPLSEKTVAANVLEHGTGALNIDGCRVHGEDAQGGAYTVKRLKPGATLNKTGGNWRPEDGGVEFHGEMKPGRWPANVIHDGSEEVLAGFPDSKGQQGDLTGHSKDRKSKGIYGDFAPARDALKRGDSGSAARFFYAAKASKKERAGSKHPTVKPLALMRYLCRLVTPPGGTVLDPFAGTGTTGQAALQEGFDAILIELDAEHVGVAEKRCRDDAPLFSGEVA